MTIVEETENLALFDLDGSLANYDKAMMAALELLRSPGEEPITDLWASESMPWIKNRKDALSRIPGYWINLEPIPEGFAVYNAAIEIGFRTMVLTQCPAKKYYAAKEKIEWIHKHLGEDVPFDLTREKKGRYGKLLYDDYPDYMDQWLSKRPRGLGIMPVNESNKNYRHPQVIRYDGTNLEYVKAVLRHVYNRKHNQPLELTSV